MTMRAHETPDYDIAIIGAGLAGLSAAITAALDGHRTLLLDAHQPGGRAQSVQREGFTFNLGAHALYRGGEAVRTLTALGVRPDGLAPDTAIGKGLRRGHTSGLPSGPLSLLRTRLLSARGKASVARMMTRIQRMTPGDLADLAHQTTAQFLADAVADPTALEFIQMMVRLTTYSADLERLSADAATTQLQLALASGVLYLHGGWQRLVDQMHARFTELGGVTVTDSAAGRVIVDDDVVTVITATDTIRAGAAVIACGGPAGAAALLDRDLGWAGRLGPRVEASCLTLALREPPAVRFLMGIDRPLYLSTHSPVAEMSPAAGGAVVEVLKYLGGSTPSTAEADRSELEAFAARSGIGPDDIVTSRFLRRMIVSGGTPIAEAGGMAGRPTVSVPGTEHVFVAGDWVGPVGMLADASLASGRAAATAATTTIAARVASVANPRRAAAGVTTA